jgi:hypothetical protein
MPDYFKAGFDMTLRKRLIRLAHAEPGLRARLLPLLKRARFQFEVRMEVDRCSGYHSPIDSDSNCQTLANRTKRFGSTAEFFEWLAGWVPKMEQYLRKTGRPEPWGHDKHQRGETVFHRSSEKRVHREGRAHGESFQWYEFEGTDVTLSVTLNGRPLHTNLHSMLNRALAGKTPMRSVIEQAKHQDFERLDPEEARARRIA